MALCGGEGKTLTFTADGMNLGATVKSAQPKPSASVQRSSSSQVTAAGALRILLADDHEVVRHGVRSLLEEHEEWVVVAEASNGEEAVQRAIETRPDVAVLDYAMPILGGLEATRQIHAPSRARRF